MQSIPTQVEESPGRPLPPAPPEHRGTNLGKVWAYVGILTGLFFFVVPGVLAFRSYRRWRAGSIRRPTFAWASAWTGVPLLVLGAYSTWALYNVPVLDDDFSDPGSGWVTASFPDLTAGYVDDAYRIERRGADWQGTYLVWNEGELPNVAVEADVVLRSGPESTAASVGCLSSDGGGFLFAIGPEDTFTIWRFDENGVFTAMRGGDLPPAARITGSGSRIRGECRAGFGDRRFTMYVDGAQIAEVAEPSTDYLAFDAIYLSVSAPGDQETADVRFDDALAIGIQPS